MNKIKVLSIIYVVSALTFTGVSSYLDYNNLESGSGFHQLSSTQRNLVRANGLGTIITNPVAIFTTPIFVGRKPRPRKENYDMTITLFVSLIPSVFIWLRIINKDKRFWNLISKKRYANKT